MYYTVNDVAKRTSLTPHTIRFYAKEGLLPFIERSASGVRMFKKENFESLFMIECLKKSGMSLKEIKAFMEWCDQGDSTIELRLEMFTKQQTIVEERIKELQETLEVVKYKKWYYETAKDAGTTAIHNTIKPEDMPENMRRFKEKVERLHD